MKFLLMLFCFFSLNAQSTKVNGEKNLGGKGLTNDELKVAKELYVLMMKSDTYIQSEKSNKLITEKLNGFELFEGGIPELRKKNNDKDGDWLFDYIKKRLTDNIEKTKFNSAKEAFDAIKTSMELTQKKLDENKELYTLLKKANRTQFQEIIEEGRGNMYDMLYNSSKH